MESDNERLNAIVDGGQAVACLSLRDYFAGQALVGIVGSGFIFSTDPNERTPRNADNFAAWSYQISDAMLKARSSK